MSASETTCDVAVIGGGIIGLTTAYYLSRAGLSVTVVERDACGRAASWAGAGIITPGSAARSDALAVMRRASAARYPDLLAELRERTGIDPQCVRCGCLDLISDDNQDAAADREVAAASASKTPSGEPAVERLSVEQLAAAEPALMLKLRGALLIREAFQVRNPRLLEALRAACDRSGVRIRENTPVVDVAVDGSRVTGVVTPSEKLSAGHVVLAAGAWSSSIGERLAAMIPVHPVRGQIVLLEMQPPPFSHILMHGKSYLVARLDGKILVGSTEEHDAGFDTRNTAGGVARLLAAAERFVPRLKNASMLRAWAGLRPGTPDGKPYIGPVPGLDNLIAATGHFRSGLTLAPITAELVTQWITENRTDLSLTDFLPGREIPARRQEMH